MSGIEELKQHKIGILGFGQEGQAVLKYLTNNGLTATIFDQKDGDNYLDDISECTLLFRSPGIWRKHPKILEAEKNGSIITSQTKWFFDQSPAKIIGVTGTKGKGTTSSLIFEILKANGRTPDKDVYLTGNIGKIQPLEFLDNTTSETIVVYELSSFQLQDLTVSPHIGVCLMVTQDHLDHHSHLEEYHFAKSSISAFQGPDDLCIYNADYEASAKIGKMGSGKKLAVSSKKKPEFGAFIIDNTISLIFPDGIEEINCAERKLRGVHNLENIAAASLVGKALGIDLNTITTAVNGFAGLEHRLQLVAEKDGVKYYNDSISTVPETTVAAINSFTEPIHLLLGGSDKGSDYTEMVKSLIQRKNVAEIILLGKTGNKIKQLLEQENSPIPMHGPYTDLAEAMNQIKQTAKSGEVVLLSPASASFDMFKSYADRGNQFVKYASN